LGDRVKQSTMFLFAVFWLFRRLNIRENQRQITCRIGQDADRVLTMGAFNDAVLTVQRRRSGGKQVVQVIHQQVAVGEGGKVIVAGTVKGRVKTAGSRRGRSEISASALGSHFRRS
jgi:hypothetical protein